MAVASLRAIREAGGGVLVYGRSEHLPRHLTVANETISQLSGSPVRTALVCLSGRAYLVDEGRTARPVGGLAGVKVAHAACGRTYVCLLSADGELFTCEGGVAATVDVPRCVAVATGEGHYVAVTTEGDVYACGENCCGQLGLGDRCDRKEPTRVESPGDIVEVSCGPHRTALLSGAGVLYLAGDNRYGVLGSGEGVPTFRAFQLPSGVPFAAVACGGSHTVGLTVEGTVWAWGQNYYGQLGVGERVETTNVPLTVADLESYFVTAIAAGAEHTALVTDEGNVIVCGSGTEGELGSADLKDAYLPKKLPVTLPAPLKVRQVVCVEGATLVLIDGPTPELIQTPSPDPELPDKIADWERIVASTLECPVCFRTMSAPIHQCATGHNLCDSCRSRSLGDVCCLCRSPFGGTRNMALETLAESLPLPCNDCLLRVPAATLETHGLACPRRSFGCPLSPTCGWTGEPGDILSHSTARHPRRTWTGLPREFHHRFDDAPACDLLSEHGSLFVLHRRYDRNSDGFRAVAVFVGVVDDAVTYRLSLEFISGRARFVANREVCTTPGGTVDELLYSPNAVVLKRRKSWGVYFRGNRVTCNVEIFARERDPAGPPTRVICNTR